MLEICRYKVLEYIYSEVTRFQSKAYADCITRASRPWPYTLEKVTEIKFMKQVHETNNEFGWKKKIEVQQSSMHFQRLSYQLHVDS